jgi:nucleotide-binding universal stress UspA family protein
MSSQKFSKVLIPVEDTVYIDLLIDFIQNHKWSPTASFRILHVRQPLMPAVAPLFGATIVLPDGMRDAQMEAAKELVEFVGARVRAALGDQRVEQLVDEGDARETILIHAYEWEADLILLTGHCRRGLNALVKGSVSRSIVEAAPCSTFVLCCGKAKRAA